LNAGIVSALIPKMRSDGTATWTVAAHGNALAPNLDGWLELNEVTIASDILRLAAVNVNARVDLAGNRVDLTRLSGAINGGALDGAGHVTLGNGGVSDIDLQLRANDLAYDAPLNLRSLSDSTIRVSRRGEEFLVAGQVTIKEAGLTSDINFDDE